jgi:uncharacterized protein (DUF305 family)
MTSTRPWVAALECRTAGIARGVATAIVSMSFVCAPILTVTAQAASAGPPVLPADVRFMEEMLGHHQQAIDMTALLRKRSRSREMLLLADRIETSQTDEMALMRRWMRRQGATVQGTDSVGSHGVHGAMQHALMPGMLSARQMQALSRATGPAFDRLFLDGMIQHHLGAITMVAALRGSPGAAQESAINRFIIDVDADQRAEISRMRRMRARR